MADGDSKNSEAERLSENYTSKPLLSKILWPNVVVCFIVHTAALYGFYLALTSIRWATLIWAIFLGIFSGFGITGGAHRLWSHRTYKAKWPLRLIVALGQTIALQQDIYVWCWDHRVHHKFSETDADPFNAKRGFFYAHVGWMLCEQHPEVQRRGKTLDMSDLLADPIVYYQRKFYVPLVLLFSVAIPIFVPCYFWGETFWPAFFVAFSMRHACAINVTWMVNSVSHAIGNHPYDRFINASENTAVAMLTLGEGWHNFHHVFPGDYKAGELGGYGTNWTTAVIDFFANFGWAYDRRTVSKEVICGRAQRTGDGSHSTACHSE